MTFMRTLAIVSGVTALMVSAFSSSFSTAQASTTYTTQGKTVVMNSALPTVLSTEEVLFVPPSVVTTSTLTQLISGMGLNPQNATISAPVGGDLEWEVAMPFGSLMVDKNTGAMFYQKRASLYANQPAVPTLLTKEGAIAAAQNFLNTYHLMPSSGLVVERVNRTLDLGVSAQGNASTQVALDQVVVFRRMVNGLLVQGPGSTIRVRLGHNGEVLGFYLDLKPYGGQPTLPLTVDKLYNLTQIPAAFEEPTIDAPTALEDFVYSSVGAQELELGSPDLKNVSVNRMALVYYAKPGPDLHTWLQPAYAFEGRLQMVEGEAVVDRPFLTYYQALEEEVEPMFAADRVIPGMQQGTFNGTPGGVE